MLSQQQNNPYFSRMGCSKQQRPDILSQADFKVFTLPNEFSFLGKKYIFAVN